MESLIELVAASFVRHGLDSPAVPEPAAAASSNPTLATSPIEPAALPEHSYRKKPDAGLAT